VRLHVHELLPEAVLLHDLVIALMVAWILKRIFLAVLDPVNESTIIAKLGEGVLRDLVDIYVERPLLADLADQVHVVEPFLEVVALVLLSNELVDAPVSQRLHHNFLVSNFEHSIIVVPVAVELGPEGAEFAS